MTKNNGLMRYGGVLIYLDGSKPSVRTEFCKSEANAKEGLIKLICDNDKLQVTAVGNPVRGDKYEWAANLQYAIFRMPLISKGNPELIEIGYVIPSDFHKKGIHLRKATRDIEN